MKARGITARAGDVIPYVFCLGEGGESSKTAQADKAKHPDEVRRESDKLKIGKLGACIDWWRRSPPYQTTSTTYLSKSCHPSSVCASPSRAPTSRD